VKLGRFRMSMPEQRGGEDKLTKGVDKEETKSKSTNKDDGIPGELFQFLKDDAVKGLY